VCTDDVLPELDVTDAMWLIHFSLPHTKTSFGFRFSCLMKNYPNVFQKSACVSVILVCLVYIKFYSQKAQINISTVFTWMQDDSKMIPSNKLHLPMEDSHIQTRDNIPNNTSAEKKYFIINFI